MPKDGQSRDKYVNRFFAYHTWILLRGYCLKLNCHQMLIMIKCPGDRNFLSFSTLFSVLTPSCTSEIFLRICFAVIIIKLRGFTWNPGTMGRTKGNYIYHLLCKLSIVLSENVQMPFWLKSRFLMLTNLISLQKVYFF